MSAFRKPVFWDLRILNTTKRENNDLRRELRKTKVRLASAEVTIDELQEKLRRAEEEILARNDADAYEEGIRRRRAATPVHPDTMIGGGRGAVPRRTDGGRESRG